MSTYVISDIHGQLDAFRAMLEKISFKLNGSDALYILGDVVDWGPDSLGTLLHIMDLVKTYPFVHMLQGNHEEMLLILLNQIREQGTPREESLAHYFKNRGDVTFQEFNTMISKEKQEEIHEYLLNLPLFKEGLMAGGRCFYLAHASPFPEEGQTKGKTQRHHTLWNRLEKEEDPFSYSGAKGQEYRAKNCFFVYGHSITTRYDSVSSNREVKIFKDLENKKIDIDCGAKVLGAEQGFEHRLACLRLEDLEEFYITREEAADFGSRRKK